MTLNLINRVEHQRKEPPPVSGILKKYYRGQWRNIFNFDHSFFHVCVWLRTVILVWNCPKFCILFYFYKKCKQTSMNFDF